MRVPDRIGSDELGWDGDRFISLDYLCVARMRSRAGPNNYNCIPSIPIDRCDSFDVVFGVFLVQDLALFCSLFAGRFSLFSYCFSFFYWLKPSGQRYGRYFVEIIVNNRNDSDGIRQNQSQRVVTRVKIFTSQSGI